MKDINFPKNFLPAPLFKGFVQDLFDEYNRVKPDSVSISLTDDEYYLLCSILEYLDEVFIKQSIFLFDELGIDCEDNVSSFMDSIFNLKLKLVRNAFHGS